MSTISLSRIHFPVTTLGPGNRIGIWMQGCSIRCPGCISADTWAAGRGQTTIEQVLLAMADWFPQADGVTISGGEPFDQPNALNELLRGIRTYTKADILVFSGYPFESISQPLEGMTGLIDALISDPYEVEAPQTKALRGSDNQRLHLFTLLGQNRLSSYERPIGSEDRRFDLMMGETGEVWMAGIPARDDFERLATVLNEQHHQVLTTQDRSIRGRSGNLND
ncbi:radical SAM protein [Rhizobium sp. Leaf306]|uniref:4Fe-4S single cluster domain-containing protein n=1 Tax=Rhizobium sp. Leaf306 TaxID=1736330 RepID=UPI000712CA01|nr:4Fe-4S single cluster domain-containing protein [Rhizobium sp. Leaf306]KQQ36537.1 radical SAM protein [Rhizobium sp. Leaf306]